MGNKYSQMMQSESSLATFARELTANMFRCEFFNQPLRLVKELTLGRGNTAGSVTGLFNTLSPFLVDARYLLTCFVADADQKQEVFKMLPVSRPESDVPYIEDNTTAQVENTDTIHPPVLEKADEESGMQVEEAPEPEVTPILVIQKGSEEPGETGKTTKDSGVKKNKKKKKNKKSDFDLPFSSFTHWLLTHKQLTKGGDWVLPKKKKKKKMHESARKSITPSDEIISESLALVLKKQGHFLEAKKMYQKLMLKWPEHATRYESEIREINENL